MVAPLLGDFGFQFRDDGIMINDDNTVAPFVDIKKVSGLDSAPFKIASRSADGRDGGYVQIEYEDIRKVIIEGEIHGSSTPIEPLLDALKANYAPRPAFTPAQPLYFSVPGVQPRVVFGKSTGFRYSWESMRRWNSTPFTVEVLCEDPTIYSSGTKTVQGNLTVANNGYTFDHAFDYSFGGFTAPNFPVVTNDGNKPVGFLATFTGQTLTNPRVTSITADSTLKLLLTLSALDTLVIDFYDEQIYFNGATRRKAVTEEGWFKLQPGGNTLTLQADSAVPAVVDISFRDGFR